MFARNLGSGIRHYFGDEFEVSLLLMRDSEMLGSDRDLFDQIHLMNDWVNQDWRRVLELPGHLLRFRKAILKLRPDVIFAIGTYSNVITSLVAGDTPVLMSEHMNMSRRVQAAPASSIMRFFMRLSYP